MNPSHSIKSTLMTALAAVLCSGLQFAGIDNLAAPRSATAEASVAQLPTVLITARRDSMTVVQRLPQVVVVGQRSDSAQALTAQAKAMPASI